MKSTSRSKSLYFRLAAICMASLVIESNIVNAAPVITNKNIETPNILTNNTVRSITLDADTDRPATSTYALGENVILKFKINEYNKSENLTLNITIKDEFGNEIKKVSLPVKDKEIIFSAPADKLGFYRVFAKLSNGSTIPAKGSRPSGFLTYCVVTDPAKRKLYPMNKTRFGMQGGMTYGINQLPYLGVRWILGGYGWHRVEPNHPGEYKETFKNFIPNNTWFGPAQLNWWYTMEKEVKKPWQVFGMPTPYNAPPKWAVIPDTFRYATGALTRKGEKAWAEYCFAVGRNFTEYTADYPKRYYQITWEPNFPWGYNGTDEQLIKIYEISYTAFHKADPKAFILGITLAGSLDEEGVKTYRRLFKKGLAKYIDGISVHHYDRNSSDSILKIRKFKAMLKECADKDLPIFCTEQGYMTKEKVKNELAQVRNLICNNLITLGEGIKFNMTFYITDYYSEPGFGYYYNLDPEKKFGPTASSPKPVVAAYAAMTFLLDGSSPVKAIEYLGDTAWGYSYERDGEITLALWDFAEKRNVEIPVGTNEVTIYDWMGNSRKVKTKKGILSIKISRQPIYITGVNSMLWGEKSLKALSIKNNLSVCPGERINITGKASAINKDTVGTGELTMSINTPGFEKKVSSDITLSGKPSGFCVPLQIPQDVPLGKYPVNVTLKLNSQLIASAGTLLCISPSLEIISVKPDVATNNAKIIKIICKNISKEKLNDILLVNFQGMPETLRKIKINLLPNETKELKVTYEDPEDLELSRFYNAKLCLTWKNSQIFTKKFKCLATYKTAENIITIDGNPDDWKNIRKYTLNGKKFLVDVFGRYLETYSGQEDLHASFKIAYNQKYLYMLVDVYDDIFWQKRSGYYSFTGDSINIGVNLDPDKIKKETGNMLADKFSSVRASMITLALTPNGPEAYRRRTFDEDKYPMQNLSRKEIIFKVTPQEKYHMIYEVAIPWSTLGIKDNAIPTKIGFAFSVNDNDYGKAPVAMGLFDGVANRLVFKPEKFGILLLKQ